MSRRCSSCDAELTPVSSERPGSTQQRDALSVAFHGGYGMFVDNTNASWSGAPRELPGQPDFEALICGPCARDLVESTPWISKLFGSAG